MTGFAVLAAVVQLLTAATFCVMPALAYRWGDTAQRAAETDLTRQGFAPEILAKYRIRFAERGVETLLPFGIALILAALAALNLDGTEAGRIASFVVQPILLLAGGFVTGSQLFAVRFVRSAFRKAGDAALDGIDVPAFMAAAQRAFPRVLRPLVAVRFVLVTVGSIAVLGLLAVS